ncbi:MAG: serine/threonine-protein kinase, partial [Bacteroidota bacterium]
MDADLWDQINTLLSDALDQPEGAREAYLVAHSPSPEVLAEVRELLAAHAAAEADDALSSPFTDAPVPDTVGPWRPLSRLGAGGMGVVYAAERIDASFRQRAALKLVRPGFGADFRDRFLRERRLLAGLDHPGIARLLDGGLTADGLPYLAMELVDGEPITAYAREREMAIRGRLELFLQACEAVAHAHRHLVVHRDLKPAHMLVETNEQGAPRVKLLDFGIAKLLDADDEAILTRTGGGPMTPQYAAPEQITGGTVTTATDVYALGVVLYELLTGQRPYDLTGLSPSEAEHMVTSATPTRPSATTDTATDTRHLRGDLDTVVMKALAKEPERRYASAEALADDIQRYLGGLPVRARPDTWQYRAGKFMRRHRVALAAGSIALAAILGGAGA